MPTYRRTSRRRRTYRRKPGRYRIYKRAGRQLWKDVKMLKDAINVEYKLHEASVQNTVINNSTTQVSLLNGVPTGDDYQNRDGRQVRFKSMELHATISANVAQTSPSFVRACIVIDRDAESLPVYTDIFEYATTYSPRNLSNRNRFVILKDWHITLYPDRPATTLKYYRKIDMKTVYDGTGSTYSDISNNALYFVWISNLASVAPLADGLMRLRYLDN